MGSLSESRKADREEMASRLVALAAQRGWNAERDYLASEVCVKLYGPRGLRGWVVFDGRRPQINHCIPWNSDARLSDAFGRAMNAAVNPFHRLKCTAYAIGFVALYAAIERAMVMAADGSAFEDSQP